MQQRDAAQAPQAFLLFVRMTTPRSSGTGGKGPAFSCAPVLTLLTYKLDTVYHSNQKLQSKKLPRKAAF